ncbi:hypothetical protein LTS08_001443 [Lithohypha guttulata]|nr:hypothetical protein LTS08_001443 [Lithohypha guttulata]
MDSKPIVFASAPARETTDFTNTFTIVLEDTDKRYTVHSDPFCTESPFLKRCLEKGFAGGQSKEIVIREEHDEEVIQQLIA